MIDVDVAPVVPMASHGRFEATRQIGIDAAHRIPDHKSKCKNLHGHRYTIHATITGELKTDGEESGMVMDFSFLKEAMMKVIDEPCDHGLILWDQDPLLTDEDTKKLFTPLTNGSSVPAYCQLGKILIIQSVPTAENLAAYWYYQLQAEIYRVINVELSHVTVWETPNCYATYKGLKT